MSEPTCGMAADPHRSCGTTWLENTAPVITNPTRVLRPVERHRCGLVGEHPSHLCPCGSMLVAARIAEESNHAD